MNKSLKHILLPSKEQGWELWQLSKDKLQHEKSIQDLTDSAVPKDVRIAFPARLVTTAPLSIPATDSETQRGIAKLQLEQNGLLKSGSESWDLFTIDKEIPLVTGVSLLDELIIDNKFKLEQTFDLAARFYKAGDLDTIICKQEQGSWVTICYKESKPFYAEHTDALSSLVTQIKSLLIQFIVQDIPFSPEKIIIEMGAEDINESFVTQLEQEIDSSVELSQKIPLVYHAYDDLKLIPSYIASTRKKKKRHEKLKLYLLIGVCLYIIGGMILLKQHKEQENQIQQARSEVDQLMPKWQTQQQDLSKLNELENVLTNQWPLASFEKVVSHLPHQQEVRFQKVEIQVSSFLIKGVAPNINHINDLETALKNDPYFKNYNWKTISKNEDKKTKLWNFSIEAIKKGAF